MRMHRSRRAGAVALLSSAAVAMLGGSLVMQPAAATASRLAPDQLSPAAGVEAMLAEAPDLSANQPDGSTTIEFHTTQDGAPDGARLAATFSCVLRVIIPRVTEAGTQIIATGRTVCNFPMASITTGVSMFRTDDAEAISSNIETELATFSVTVHTFTSCQSGLYFAVAATTVIPPPGFFPPQASAVVVSQQSPISVGETSVPPFICELPSAPTPSPSPTSGGAPVISSLRCEYFGANRFECHVGTSNWTRIRWTYNGTRQPTWDDQTTVQSGCGGGTPLVEVFVSNAAGTTTARDSFRCEGQPL